MSLFDNEKEPLPSPEDALQSAINDAKSEHLSGGSRIAQRNALTARTKGIVNVNKNTEKIAYDETGISPIVMAGGAGLVGAGGVAAYSNHMKQKAAKAAAAAELLKVTRIRNGAIAGVALGGTALTANAIRNAVRNRGPLKGVALDAYNKAVVENRMYHI